MEKKYISVSKGFIEKRMNIIFDLEHKMIEAKPYIKANQILVNVGKGIEEDTLHQGNALTG